MALVLVLMNLWVNKINNLKKWENNYIIKQGKRGREEVGGCKKISDLLREVLEKRIRLVIFVLLPK